MRLLRHLAALLVAAAGLVAAPAWALTAQQRAIVLAPSYYADAVIALDFTGAKCPGHRPCFKVGTRRTTNFPSLPGYAFSRASVGYTACNGVLRAFGVNQPRIDPACGLLIEQASTNYFLNSFTPATQTITLPATGSFTTSVWGSGSVTTSAGTATCTGYGASSAGASNTISCTATGTVVLTVAGSPTAVNFENLAFGTSPIPTTTASATRPADLPKITGVALPGAYTVISAAQLPAGPNSVLNNQVEFYSIDDNSSQNSVQTFYNINNSAFDTFQAVGGSTVTALALSGASLGAINTSAISINPAGSAASVNGGAASSGAAQPVPASTQIQLGRGPTSAFGGLNGYMRKLIIPTRTYGASELPAASSQP
jgi:hypothetical protein